jgi:murein DD-endopeptidase MepM/ murein hydrolase activator NlpD
MITLQGTGMKVSRLVAIILWITLHLAACQGRLSPTTEPTPRPPASPVPLRPTVTPTATIMPSATIVPSPALQDVTLNPHNKAQMCSPLPGFSLADLEDAISNPYDPPAAGLDGPHQGIDFADLEPTNRYAQEGLAVNAVLAGTVGAIVNNRFPYGNALLIETALDDLPPAWLEGVNLPAPQPAQTPHPALTCPDLALPGWDLQTRSLYLLYAHLQQPPQLATGEAVTCGQIIGAIGSSGNALNPHLHLEIRVGPSNAQFDSLAHYDASARPDEMANYCTWRVRGIFQLIDPLLLLHLGL